MNFPSPVGRLCAVGRRDGECTVDPGFRRELGELRRASRKAVGSGGVGRGEHLLSVLDHLEGAAEVDLLGREQADVAVAVFGVVPLEELPGRSPFASLISRTGPGSPGGTSWS